METPEGFLSFGGFHLLSGFSRLIVGGFLLFEVETPQGIPPLGQTQWYIGYWSSLYIQCLAEKLAVSLSGIRKAAVVFILHEVQKSLIHGLKELEICHNLPQCANHKANKFTRYIQNNITACFYDVFRVVINMI